MTITVDSMKHYIQARTLAGATEQDIEEDFKNLLRCKLISVDDYAKAMELIYGGD